jgi:hypothetical protein
MSVDFLLVEDQGGVRPTRGIIVCGGGTRRRFDNEEVRE